MEIQILRDQVLNWTQQCRRTGPQGPTYVMGAAASTPTVMALCFAVLTLELYDLLPDAHSEEWQYLLLSLQDPKTGLFIDPLLSANDLTPTSPGVDYLHYQTTYFALNALDALGYEPKYPLHFVERFYDPSYMQMWLEEQLDWSNPWRESNWIMFVATALYAAWQRTDDHTAQQSLHHLLDWLDSRQDPQTGFWGLKEGASVLNAMAGAYHFLPYYFCLGRPLHCLEQMIDSTLSLQQPDGLFHPDIGGDACLDVDAADILAKCSLLTPHRADEVQLALTRVFEGLMSNQDDAGGFCRARHRPLPPKSRKRRLAEAFGLDRLLRKPYLPPVQIWHYSGWKKMPYDIRQGDLWSTWFRSYGLAVISARYPGQFFTGVPWQFRPLPALGWHDETRIRQGSLDVSPSHAWQSPERGMA